MDIIVVICTCLKWIFPIVLCCYSLNIVHFFWLSLFTVLCLLNRDYIIENIASIIKLQVRIEILMTVKGYTYWTIKKLSFLCYNCDQNTFNNIEEQKKRVNGIKQIVISLKHLTQTLSFTRHSKYNSKHDGNTDTRDI